MNHQETLQKAKNFALNLLSYRPRSIREMTARLQQRGFEGDVIEAVIGFLVEYDFINDEVYAKNWVQCRCKAKPMGKARLRMEMQQKGLNRGTIDRALALLAPDEEYNMALSLAEKKIQRQPTSRNMEKIKTFLYRRGFAPELILRIIKELECQNLDSDRKNL